MQKLFRCVANAFGYFYDVNDQKVEANSLVWSPLRQVSLVANEKTVHPMKCLSS